MMSSLIASTAEYRPVSVPLRGNVNNDQVHETEQYLTCRVSVPLRGNVNNDTLTLSLALSTITFPSPYGEM